MSQSPRAPGFLDHEILDEIREDMEEEFPEFVQAFLDEAGEWIQTMTTAISADDSGSLYEIAHALKSSSGYVGATTLQNIAERLESLGRRGSTTGASTFLDAAQQEFTAVREALQPFVPA